MALLASLPVEECKRTRPTLASAGRAVCYQSTCDQPVSAPRFTGTILVGVDPQPNPRTSGTGNGLFRTAMALFIVGFLAIVAIFAVHIFSDTPPGLALYLVALACPIGFTLAIVYTLRSGRRVR